MERLADSLQYRTSLLVLPLGWFKTQLVECSSSPARPKLMCRHFHCEPEGSTSVDEGESRTAPPRPHRFARTHQGKEHIGIVAKLCRRRVVELEPVGPSERNGALDHALELADVGRHDDPRVDPARAKTADALDGQILNGRRSLACAAGDRSDTSSRRASPRGCANSPRRPRTPVAVRSSIPKSSASSRVSTIAAQLTATKGPLRRRLSS